MAKRKVQNEEDAQQQQQVPIQQATQSLSSTSTLNKHVKLELSSSHLVMNQQQQPSSSLDPLNSLPIKSKDPPKMIMLPEYLQSNNTQKRRRVVRACDRCRKLKIKCSGDLPCIHCTVYNYECTYDQPNKSKRKGTIIKKEETQFKGPNNRSTTPTNNNPSNNSNPQVILKSVNTLTNEPPSDVSSNTMDRFNSSTVSLLASSNPELFSKLTDRLKLYDDILHRLLPEIKLTDLNDNPKPINPMKLMSALNKLRDSGKYASRPTSKQIAKTYDSLPDIPLPVIPITKLPPNQITVSQPQQLKPQIQSQSPSSQQQQQINDPRQFPLPKRASTVNNLQQDIDGSIESTMGREIKIILPSREVALDLITKTWENACVLFRFYHRVAFIEDLNELYDTDPTQYTNKQQRFLPLVYSVMACGALFYKSDRNTTDSKFKNNNKNNENNNINGNDNENINNSNNNNEFIEEKDFDDEGYKYFIAARKLIDITDTRDTYGIQTIVMLIIFLQCSARLSTCYAYIGIALRAALREGLHRKLDYPFNPIELEIRKRLFWTIYKMDIYVNTMLGLPRTISSDDFDQDLPEELDDENITVTCYRYDKQNDRLSSSGIANAHTRLIFLMKEVVTKLYPIKPKKRLNIHEDIDDGDDNTNGNNNKTKHESIRNNFVYDLELKLQEWMNSLPIELKPGIEPPQEYIKANRLLHISYLHVKIILYRPFIHYISSNFKSNSNNDLTCIENAKNCINVARVVVKLAEDMIDKNMLSGSYWFSIYTIFFSVACLVYYVHFAPSLNKNGKLDFEYIAIKKDAEKGKKVLDILKDSSMAARRTYNILNAVFEQLNRKTARTGSSGKNSYNNNGKTNNNNTNNNTSTSVSPSNNINKWDNNTNNKEAITPKNANANTKINAKTPTNKNTNMTTPVEYTKPSEPILGMESGKSISPILDPSNMSHLYYGMGNMDMNNMNVNNVNMQMNMDINDIDLNMNNTGNTNNDNNMSMNIPVNMNMNMDFNDIDLNDIVDINYNSNNSGENVTKKNEKQNGFNDITEYKYVQGPMDQLDMKIFGRFLPPYMLNNDLSNNSNNDGEVRDSDNRQDKNGGDNLFEPSLGLFSYVKEGQMNDGSNTGDNGILSEKNRKFDQMNNNNNSGAENSNNNETSNNNNQKTTRSNAIPSGLSTVYQSETDKNPINVLSDDGTNDVLSGGETENNGNGNNIVESTTIELPSRFSSSEGIGMLDELLFGSAWDEEANK